MAKPIPKRKKKVKAPGRERGFQVMGFDTSMSSLAGAAIGYDAVLRKFVGPKFCLLRWSKEDDYFVRLKEAAKAHELVQDVQAALGFGVEHKDLYLAQEEPFPPHTGFMGRGVGASLKQQAEISGAFLSGLLRYGYENLWQIRNDQWRKLIADDLDITTHFSKWRSPDLALRFNCKPTDSGKFRAKEWALDGHFETYFYRFFGYGADEAPEDVPDWPDIIASSKEGKIPRPEGSVAKAVQPDDRYDALAIMAWLVGELQTAGVFKAA